KGQDFAGWSRTIPDQLASDSSIKGYRQVKVDSRPDQYRIDFATDANPDNPLISYAASATVGARPAGTMACVVELFYPQGQEAKYGPIADALVAGDARPVAAQQRARHVLRQQQQEVAPAVVGGQRAAAGRAEAVVDARRGREDAPPAGQLRAPVQVDVLAVHEEILVEDPPA